MKFIIALLLMLIPAISHAQDVEASQLAAVLEPEGGTKVFVKGDNGVLREISRVVLIKGNKELLPDNPADADQVVIETVAP